MIVRSESRLSGLIYIDTVLDFDQTRDQVLYKLNLINRLNKLVMLTWTL